MRKLDDHSLLATENSPETETCTVVFNNVPQGVTGLRLELLPHETLPENGPGRAFNGNCVLNELTATDANGTPVAFKGASASWQQGGFGVADAIDGNTAGNTGWAVLPQTGQHQAAVFETANPEAIAAGPLTVTLQQAFGSQHTIGRFRVAVCQAFPLPRDRAVQIDETLALPAGERTQEQAALLRKHYLETAHPDIAALQSARAKLKERQQR